MKDLDKEVALDRELANADRLIRFGLDALLHLDRRNDFFFAHMLVLSSGLERLMKIVIVLSHRAEQGDYPDKEAAKFTGARTGHDLQILFERIQRDCRPVNGPPLVLEDWDFACTDQLLSRILGALSRFGVNGRYYYLDTVLGSSPNGQSPDDEWAQIESDATQGAGVVAPLNPGTNLDEALARANRRIRDRLERFVRSLAHLFHYGSLGDLGKTFGSRSYLLTSKAGGWRDLPT